MGSIYSKGSVSRISSVAESINTKNLDMEMLHNLEDLGEIYKLSEGLEEGAMYRM